MNTKRSLFACYQAVVCALAVALAGQVARHRDAWYVGDWLINYEGGFVRRGLPGQLIFLLARLTHLPPPWLVFAVSVALYLIYQFALFRMTAEPGWTGALVAMLLSPATLAFQILNPGVGLRKEVLLFAVVALAVSSAWIRTARASAVSVAFAIACVVLVLSHEGSLLYLPYLLAALLLARPDALRVAVLPAIATLVAAIAVLLHPGSLTIATAICSSVGETMQPLPHLCGGEIASLQTKLAQAHLQTLPFVRLFHFVPVYSVLAFLSLAPTAMVARSFYRQAKLRKPVLLIGCCAAVAMVASLLLFWSGIDWGRWISMHAICLMLLLVSTAQNSEARTPQPVKVKRYLRWLAIAIYATCWLLPVVAYGTRPRLAGYYDAIGIYTRSIGHSSRRGRAFFPS